MLKSVATLGTVIALFVSACLSSTQILGGRFESVVELRTQTVQDLGGLPDLYEASIAELQSGLESGLFTSVDLVKVSVVVLKGCTHFLTSLIM